MGKAEFDAAERARTSAKPSGKAAAAAAGRARPSLFPSLPASLPPSRPPSGARARPRAGSGSPSSVCFRSSCHQWHKAAAEAGPLAFHPRAESARVAPATRGHVTSTCSAGWRPPTAAICFPQSAPGRSRHLRGRVLCAPRPPSLSNLRETASKKKKNQTQTPAPAPPAPQPNHFTDLSNLFKCKVRLPGGAGRPPGEAR